MASPKLFNLAQMTTSTMGTGPITLGSATVGYRSFTASGVVSGDTVVYSIYDSGNHEYGTGVVTVAGPTVTMTRVLGGSTTGSLLSLSGVAIVSLSPRAEDFSLRDYTPSEPGAVTRPVSGKIDEISSLFDFIDPTLYAGIMNRTSTTDVSASVSAWLSYLLTNGGEGLVPAGTYYITSGVTATLNASASIRCSSGATFVAGVGFPHARMFLVNPGTTANVDFKWTGGAFNGANVPNSLPGEANDIFSFNATNCVFCDIFLDSTTAGADWLHTGSDSHLFIGGATNVRAGIGRAVGSADAAIYISGSADGSIGHSLYAYGSFEKCYTSVIVKRTFNTYTIDINTTDCLNGAGGGTATNNVGVLIPPGDNAFIKVNAIRTERPVFLQAVSNAVVDVNSKDMGVSITGYTSVSAFGCYLTGASNCTVRVNATGTNPLCTANTNFVGVNCDTRVVNVTTYMATDNVVHINANNLGKGFAEDVNADRNVFVIKESNSITASAVTGASSVMVRALATANGMEFDSPIIALGGTHNAEALRVTKAASQVNFVNISGAATAGMPSIGSSGSDANVNMAITTKGTGVIVLGGPAGSEALRVGKGVTSGNAVEVDSAATGAAPVVKARGIDTNIELSLSGKGTGGVTANVIRASADVAGVAATNTLTNVSDVTANSTGIGTILFKGATSRNSTGFIKIYVGTTAYYIPIFSAITG